MRSAGHVPRVAKRTVFAVEHACEFSHCSGISPPDKTIKKIMGATPLSRVVMTEKMHAPASVGNRTSNRTSPFYKTKRRSGLRHSPLRVRQTQKV